MAIVLGTVAASVTESGARRRAVAPPAAASTPTTAEKMDDCHDAQVAGTCASASTESVTGAKSSSASLAKAPAGTVSLATSELALCSGTVVAAAATPPTKTFSAACFASRGGVAVVTAAHVAVAA